jgi:hypothetical protein
MYIDSWFQRVRYRFLKRLFFRNSLWRLDNLKFFLTSILKRWIEERCGTRREKYAKWLRFRLKNIMRFQACKRLCFNYWRNIFFSNCIQIRHKGLHLWGCNKNNSKLRSYHYSDLRYWVLSYLIRIETIKSTKLLLLVCFCRLVLGHYIKQM